MPEWGYKIHDDRQIVWEEGDFQLVGKVRLLEPSVCSCIACGTCAATCTAARFTDFSLRRVIVNLQRGQVDAVRQEITKCLLCGKCQLACPRAVNTRNLVLSLRKALG